MTIQTYDDLKTAVGDWLNNSKITSRIPDFITMAEARIFRELRLHVWEVRATTPTEVGKAFYARPTDSLGIQAIRLNTDPIQNLKYESPYSIDSRYLGSTQGQPVAYTVQGGQFRLAPSPDATYIIEITYIRKPENLSDSVSTNWFTENAPDLLLYGALIEASPYMKENEMLIVWAERYKQIKADIIREDNKVAYPRGSIMRSRVV